MMTSCFVHRSVFPTSRILLLLVLRLAIWAGATDTEVHNGHDQHNEQLRFGLMNGGSDFFGAVERGFLHKCTLLGVTCYTVTSNSSRTITCEEERRAMIRELVSLGVNGVAMKPCTYGEFPNLEMNALIEEVTEAGIPVVTFDSDAINSTRSAYVGTDQRFLGRTMARLLRQLRPEGGTYGIVSSKEGRYEGFVDEISRYNNRDDRAHWHEVFPDVTELMGWDEILQRTAELDPTAIVIMKQSPMRIPNWTDFVDANRQREITIIGVDGADYQLDYLNRRYVDGLVGQLPYEMGSESVQVIYDIKTKGPQSRSKGFYTTNVVSYNVIPIELPPVDLDENLIGDLKFLGFFCFGAIALSALLCIFWTYYYRACTIVRAAQPIFLDMVAVGVLIMASSLIPLSVEEHDNCELEGEACVISTSDTYRIGVCMSTPWLGFTGFTVIFSALFSKTWRVNRLFKAESTHRRVHVNEFDVLSPFALLLTCNIVVLTWWTVFDPLTYIRQEHDGTDYWNRAISTYGSCRSDNAMPYLTSLAVVNFSLVSIACWQAFQARNLTSEFSESNYIGLTVASLFQAFVTGMPVVAVVRDNPQAFYVVSSLIICLLSFAVLLLTFLPKMRMQRQYSNKSEAEQRRLFMDRVRCSASGHNRYSSNYYSSNMPSNMSDGNAQSQENGYNSEKTADVSLGEQQESPPPCDQPLITASCCRVVTEEGAADDSASESLNTKVMKDEKDDNDFDEKITAETGVGLEEKDFEA